MIKDYKIIVRGGGDIATGIIHSLHCSGFKVLVLETGRPTTIRRSVAVSSAVHQKKCKVETMYAELAENIEEVEKIWNKNRIPVLIDENADSLSYFHPEILIDAVLAKKNLGTKRSMAKFTIGVGPGFEAKKDVDVVIETMRGHKLGRIIEKGCALANTGIPGLIAGHDKDRVVHSPATGTIKVIKDITSRVEEKEIIALIQDKNKGEINVPSPISGVVRGMISDGFFVNRGLKIADIDPRNINTEDCYTISDKARCIGGSCLEAVMGYLKGEI